MTLEEQIEELELKIKELQELLETERVSHRNQLSRMLRKNTEHAVSGAAMASRLASNDPDAQRVLVDSVKAIRNPAAVLARIGKALDEPLQCGHPLDCLPDHDWEDAANISCGWCVDLERAVRAETLIGVLRAWFGGDQSTPETDYLQKALDAYDALTRRST